MDNTININSIINLIQVLTTEDGIDKLFIDKKNGMVLALYASIINKGTGIIFSPYVGQNNDFFEYIEKYNNELSRNLTIEEQDKRKYKFIIGEQNQKIFAATIKYFNPFSQKYEKINDEYVDSICIEDLIEIKNIDEGTLIRFVEDYLNNNEYSAEYQKLLNVLRDTRFYRFSDNCHDFINEIYWKEDKTKAFYSIIYDYLKTLLEDICRKNNIKYNFNEISADEIDIDSNAYSLHYIFVNEQTLVEIYNNYPLLQDLEVTNYDKFLGKGKENEKTGLFRLFD